MSVMEIAQEGPVVIAHAGHWLVQAAYFLPVVAFLAWLGWTTLKERRADREDEAG